MEPDLCESLDQLSIQSSSESKESLGVHEEGVNNVPSNKDDECHIYVAADLIPHLDPVYGVHDSFYDWLEKVEPITKEVPLICKDKEQAMDILNQERNLILEHFWEQKEQIQRLQRDKEIEERNRQLREAQLEKQLYWKMIELAECRKALTNVQKEFEEYKDQHEPKQEETGERDMKEIIHAIVEEILGDDNEV